MALTFAPEGHLLSFQLHEQTIVRYASIDGCLRLATSYSVQERSGAATTRDDNWVSTTHSMGGRHGSHWSVGAYLVRGLRQGSMGGTVGQRPVAKVRPSR